MDPVELRNVLDRLYSGTQETMFYLVQLRAFEREHAIFRWLDRNGLHGKKLVEFFQNESFTNDGKGVLNAVNFIIRRLDSDPFKIINTKDLK